MAQNPPIKMPRWVAPFFVAYGSLGTLVLDGTLTGLWDNLAFMACMGASIWFLWYRRRLDRESVHA